MATDDKIPAADACGGGGVAELPAPDGWKKKRAFSNEHFKEPHDNFFSVDSPPTCTVLDNFLYYNLAHSEYVARNNFTPKKSSGRNDILFISPTGDEIRSKIQLDKYLKSHPGGPSASEFDWSTGETPRRSGRISDKVKATEAPEIEPPSKRFSAKKDSRARKENMDIENKDLENDEDALVEKENEKSKEVEKTDGREATENNAQNAVVEEPMQPVTEETVADVSNKEQADDHVDTPIEEITDSGTENRLAEPEATPENEDGEVNAGLDVNEDDSSVKVETQPAENPRPEIKVADNTQAESNSELPRYSAREGDF